MTLRQLRKAARYIGGMLDGHADVTSIGIGMRVKNGKATDQRVVMVGVERKRKKVPADALIPAVVETPFGLVETDVEALPSAKLRTASNGFLDGADVVVGSTRGSIAFVIDGPTGSPRFAVTNADVVTAPDGSGVGNPAFVDTPGKPLRRIGVVAAHTPYRTNRVNAADVALIDLDPALDVESTTWTVDPWPGRKITRFVSLSTARQETYHYVSTANGLVEEVECDRVDERTQPVTLIDSGTGRRVRFSKAFKLRAKAPGGPGRSLRLGTGAQGVERHRSDRRGNAVRRSRQCRHLPELGAGQ